MEVETKKFGLLDLPQELVLYSCDRESLENTIKNALLLKNTCTYFHTLLSPTDVGKFCKSRDITEKNQEMKKLLSFMYDENYWNIRNAALMLVHAGADNAAGDYQGFSLLKNAIDQKDKEMITILFDNNTNPNQKNGQWPDWFYIRDVDIAQMFINHKVDLQIETDNEPNILWFLVDYAMCYPPFELIEFYVKNNVDVKKRETSFNGCILHEFTRCVSHWSKIDDYVKSAKLLLEISPELMNMINKEGMTPLDLAKYRYHRSIDSDETKEQLLAIIKLFENYNNKEDLEVVKNEGDYDEPFFFDDFLLFFTNFWYGTTK